MGVNQAYVIDFFVGIHLETQTFTKNMEPHQKSRSNKTSLTPPAGQLCRVAQIMTKPSNFDGNGGNVIVAFKTRKCQAMGIGFLFVPNHIL